MTVKYSGPRFNIKMSSYQYRKTHCGDKTVVKSSYIHNGISYAGKMSLYWIRALVSAPENIHIFFLVAGISSVLSEFMQLTDSYSSVLHWYGFNLQVPAQSGFKITRNSMEFLSKHRIKMIKYDETIAILNTKRNIDIITFLNGFFLTAGCELHNVLGVQSLGFMDNIGPGSVLIMLHYPDSKVHGTNMGPSGADRTQVAPMNFAIWVIIRFLARSSMIQITTSRAKWQQIHQSCKVTSQWY